MEDKIYLSGSYDSESGFNAQWAFRTEEERDRYIRLCKEVMGRAGYFDDDELEVPFCNVDEEVERLRLWKIDRDEKDRIAAEWRRNNPPKKGEYDLAGLRLRYPEYYLFPLIEELNKEENTEFTWNILDRNSKSTTTPTD